MRSLLYIGILFSMYACAPTAPDLQPGDLLFQVGIRSSMSGAITATTGHDNTLSFTHVGIFIPGKGADSVLEATSEGGVRLTSLPEFLDRADRIARKPAVVAMRLRDTSGVSASLSRARRLLGLPYDYSFRPDNGKFYCSELIWESYRDTAGKRLFTARPMNFRAADGTMPDFWVELFEKLGEPIPEGVPGTNPNDMAREEILTEVGRYF